jgi:hypothetical protein
LTCGLGLFLHVACDNEREHGNDAGFAPQDARQAVGASDRDAQSDGASSKPDYGNPTVKPDTSTNRVADCSGQPDMTLCNVVTTPDRWYDICVRGACVSPGCGEASCESPGPHFRIPPMSEHKYFERRGSEEPINIDLITGLHWQGCAAGLRGAGCQTGAALELDVAGALAYCDALQWGAHDDWYLPDIYELVSIVDVGVPNPEQGYLSEAFFPNHAVAPGFFWSSSTLDSRQMSLSTGKDEGSFPSITWEDTRLEIDGVLCVRRGFSEPMPAGERFHRTQSTQPTAADRATGLMFQSCAAPAGAIDCSAYKPVLRPEDAVAHCEALVWGGFEDWRLPTYKELQPLFSYGQLGSFENGFRDDLVGVVASYLLVQHGPLFDLIDSARVGIGSSGEMYPAVCVRGP